MFEASSHSWEEFALRNPDLLRWQPSVLDRYYVPGTLRSELARRVFVFPDRLPTAPSVKNRKRVNAAAPGCHRTTPELPVSTG